jgi:aryl-alcohol dehydrogenase-like predicted oxidoreductase
MLYGEIPGIDKPVSRLAQGTLMVTSEREEWGFRLLDEIFALGCTTFDTAHAYGQGDSERTLGRWVNSRGIRDQVVVITKGAHHSIDRKRVTPFDITSDLYDSLARFKFAPIDFYLLHRDDPTQPVGPIIEVLNEHLKAGRIRAFGASNWSQERLQEANAYARAHDLAPFVASSPNFSLAEQVQDPWPDCVTISGRRGAAGRAWYQQERMPVFAWSSLAGGFFSGRFRRDNLDTFEDYFDKVCVTSYCYEENFQRLDRVRLLADEMGLTIPQVAMAYVMNQPLNLFALVGCQSSAEFKANVEACEIKLSPETLEWLDLKREER